MNLFNFYRSGKALGYGMWLFFDNLVYLAKIKVISDRNMAQRDKKSAYYWFFGIMCAILINLREIIQNMLLGKQTSNSTYLQLARNSIDLLTPGFKLEFAAIRAIAPNKGVVGLAGSISSLISIYLLWPALKR